MEHSFATKDSEDYRRAQRIEALIQQHFQGEDASAHSVIVALANVLGLYMGTEAFIAGATEQHLAQWVTHLCRDFILPLAEVNRTGKED